MITTQDELAREAMTIILKFELQHSLMAWKRNVKLPPFDPAEIAKTAYDIADAMLDERAKRIDARCTAG